MATHIISTGPEETRAIGRIVGEHAAPGDVVLLTGELGTGKTCLTQGILSGLGSDELARSPTFVLIAEYRGRMPMYHMDLYRIGSLEQAEELGIDEYLDGDGLTVVEWADNVPGIFPRRLAPHPLGTRLGVRAPSELYGRHRKVSKRD